MLSAMRGVLKAAWRLGQLDAETYHRAVDLEGVKGERLPTGRNITAGEISAMFAACASEQSPAGIRDAVILALLRLGLRRQEIAGLELADYNLVEETLTVRGKRDKERLVPLMGGAAEALADWLTLRGNDAGPLLLRINKGKRILPKGITAQAVYNALAKRAEQAGVSNLTPHDWRRTFVGDLLDAGADLSVVQKLAGHASPQTTARYDRRPEAAKRRAVERLHIPWERRTLHERECG
jgi:site-specific recombinase XerD